MPSPAVRPSDVATIDAILHALYEVISGPAGQPRDWDRYRSLFLPGARLMPIVSIPGEKAGVRFLSVEDYIHRVEPIFAIEDFWERESSRRLKPSAISRIYSASMSLSVVLADYRSNAARTVSNCSMTVFVGGSSA